MARTKQHSAPPPGELHAFEGRDVISTKVAIVRAGDGLSQALNVEPVELPLGTKVFVVLEGTIDKVTHEKYKDTDKLVRVHRLSSENVTMVDESLVRETLDAQIVKIEKAKGVERLDFEGDPDADPA